VGSAYRLDDDREGVALAPGGDGSTRGTVAGQKVGGDDPARSLGSKFWPWTSSERASMAVWEEGAVRAGDVEFLAQVRVDVARGWDLVKSPPPSP